MAGGSLHSLGDVDENPGSIDKDQLREWLDDGAIEWPGHVEVMPWLALASVFVLPTYYREAFHAASRKRWQWVVQ